MFKSSLVLLVSVFFGYQLIAQQLLINEISQGSGQKEYVEFIVAGNPTCQSSVPCLDLRGVVIDDNNGYFAAGSSTGIAMGAVRFANITFWSCIPQGTLILVYNDSDVNPEIPPNDLSMTDGNCKLIIPINSTLLEGQTLSPTITNSSYPASVNWVSGAGNWSQVAMSNSDDSFQIRSSISSTIANHSVSWGNNTLSTQITFSNASGKVFYMGNNFDNNSFSQSNWNEGLVGSNETPGTANNIANDNWISSMNPMCGVSNPMTLTVNSTPTACGTTCTGSASVSILNGTPPYTIAWSNGGSTASINSLCAATYTVTVTDASGCSNSDQIEVSNAASNLAVQLNVTNESCSNNCDGSISSSVTGGTPPYSYLWNNTSIDPNVSELCPGGYTLSVSDQNGCSVVNAATINPIECATEDFNVYIPNVFTPNNDNSNDTFLISISGGKLESGFIINRWGNIIYEFSEKKTSWSGETNNGVPVSDGVYNYLVTIRPFEGQPKKYHGFVTIIR